MLDKLKGIGPKTLEELNNLNIYNIEDLLMHYPYRYNYYQPIDIKSAQDNEDVTITGIVERNATAYYIKRSLNVLNFTINTNNILVKIVAYNRGFMKNHIKAGNKITVTGKYNKFKNTIIAGEIINEEITSLKIEPVYRLTKKLKKHIFNKIMIEALKDIKVNNYIPNYLNREYNFIDKNLAIKNIHNPSDIDTLKQSKLMLIYEELFIFMLKINYLKNNQKSIKENNIKKFKESDVNNFINSLPFKLTKDQIESINDIISDFNSNKRMNRLILGDVGSGKTIVGFIALYINFLSNYQGVLMAPTEILAFQHFNNFKNIFKDVDIKCQLLTSSTKPKDRIEIIKNLKNGKTNILISTHSVLNEEVVFKNLGLVITDEQHRFGVKQRKNLQEKGKDTDVIYMSATPIPRTLALTIYGDMDISQIKTKPQNNKEVITKVLKEDGIKEVLYEILEEIKKGHQAYVIVPLVEENESELEDVQSIYDKFNIAYNKKIPMEMIHGKLKNEEKEEIMQNFKEGKTKILISTTVIEVGIDVKNATVIAIFNAERFGLATLHQLRGRVGRSDLQSKCFIISNYEKERLDVLEESNDGFYISEKDFELRSAGDIFGIKQSGDMEFKLANLKTDYKILLQCKKDAEEFLNKNKDNLDDYPNQKKILSSIDLTS